MLSAGMLRHRWRVVLSIAIAVLAVHAALLGGVEPRVPRPAPAAVAAVQVREIVVPAPVPEPGTAVPERAQSPAPQAKPRPAPRRAPVARGAEPARETAMPAPTDALVPVAAAGDLPAVAPGDDSPSATVDASLVAQARPPITDDVPMLIPIVDRQGADTPPPTYPTRVPPTATIRYDLRRGAIGGAGELRWTNEGGQYRLRLDGSVVGISVLEQVSEGSLAATGLAPQRFTDRRARRSTMAANFDRAARSVSFSGPTHRVPLLDGAQDRLSWMIQLAAIFAADPTRAEPGAHTEFQVVGARGDSARWQFRAVGTETIQTRAGPVTTRHVVREPRGTYDTAVEVWLDPARHFLPLRATMRNGEDGDVMELRLKNVIFGS